MSEPNRQTAGADSGGFRTAAPRPAIADSPPGYLGELVAHLPAVLYVAEEGDAGRWHYVSAGIERILGFTAQEWREDPTLWARQMHPDDRERIYHHEQTTPDVPAEYRMRHRDGSVVWLRDEARLIRDVAGNKRWHGVILDITDRKLAEAELERRVDQQAVVARLGRDALEGKHVNDLMRDALGEATRVLGVRMGAVLERQADGGTLVLAGAIGLGPHDAAAQRAPSRPAAEGANGHGRAAGSALPYNLAGGAIGQIVCRGRLWGAVWVGDGTSRELASSDGNFVQSIANIIADAIQRRATEEEIRYRALHDPLTDLPNRSMLLESISGALERRSDNVALVMMDIDNFKLVNDSFGHAAGDELLKQIAPRLKEVVREGDVIARLGGDEFVVLLEHASPANSRRFAERVLSAFEAPFRLGTHEHLAKVSLGVALAGHAGQSTAASLLQDADAALYVAKRRGRAHFEIFDRAMRVGAIDRLALENDLGRALRRDELRLVYQPVVSLHDRSIVSFEALLRWQHPERGLVKPADFVPVAEETGLIEPIGRWVLHTACGQLAEWQAHLTDAAPLAISVNLSVRQFLQRDFELMVAEALAETSLDPSGLCLEITESVLLDEPQSASERLERIAQTGVRFALDDFGTGYSSLAYLGGLPISVLKVDRSFVSSITNDERSKAITTAIVGMADALELQVVAEGVEDESQLRTVRNLGCDLAQGYLFSAPLAAGDAARLLALGRRTAARAPVG
ncbi:MAG TPA: EAL domain-containing protein [Solirubrobacteraceae bacterium]|nr:EAL domain-containing protein [Solirubrobacteraceae bacterium]